MAYSDPRQEQQALLKTEGTLLILRAPALPPVPPLGQPGAKSTYLQDYDEVFVAVSEQGWIRAFSGKVDLGTGTRTALTQIAADELDVAMDKITMVMGHTDAVPNQGPTIASETIQVSAHALRRAAAQARQILLKLAAEALGHEVSMLRVNDGVITALDGQETDYWSLLKGKSIREYLDNDVPTKVASELRLVGRSMPRVDIPSKVTGEFTYVHDVRLEGMWHGRVVRPPYVGRDSGDFIGHTLVSVDESSVKAIHPDIKVFVKADFVGVVARREEHAIKAMKALKVEWKPVPPEQDLSNLEAAIRRQPSTLRLLRHDGVDGQLPVAQVELQRTYVWPYQLHASIGPSCAVADYQLGHVKVWSGTQNPHMLRVHLSELIDLEEGQIEIVRLEASGCYGRNCADDVCADALLLSQFLGAPVRVQLTREQEHGWEPKGAAQLMDVEGSVDANGKLRHYSFSTYYPSNDGPLLALFLTGKQPAEPRVLQMGDRTAVPPYDYINQKIVCNDLAPLVRASWLRGVSALPNSFAHECFIDELAYEVGADPVDFRVSHLTQDSRAQDLIKAVAEKAEWYSRRSGSRGKPDEKGWLHGMGVAYACYVHSKFPGFGAAWSAWIVDISVRVETGEVVINRAVIGQDTGQMVNPAGVRHQLHGNAVQAISRTLYEEVLFDEKGPIASEWGGYRLIDFSEIPPIDVVFMDRQDQPPMGAGESASIPCGPAIANALFDACGMRFYEAPFTPERIRACMQKANEHVFS